MAILACEIIGLKRKKIISCLSRIKSVKGRLELVRTFKGNRKAFIDFAHTPDAIKNAINTLKSSFKK